MATAAGPQLTRPDVLAVVETMQIINTVLERLATAALLSGEQRAAE